MKTFQLATGQTVIVDDEDFERVSLHKWHSSGRYVAMRTGNVCQYLHRFIMQPKLQQQVDHINGDPFDNRRSNLRCCTASQNSINRPSQSKYRPFRGVSWSQGSRNRWTAEIVIHRQTIRLGSYPTAVDAAFAYDMAAVVYHGEYAQTNFPT